MGEKILDIEQRTKYIEEIKNLKEQNGDLESLNNELLQRLDGLEGEYKELRKKLNNKVSLQEIFALRKKILELQNELRLKNNVLDVINEGHS